MGSARAELVEHAAQVGAEISEGERPFVVVTVAIPPGIPDRYMEAIGERLHLVAPVLAVAADAVHEHHQRPGAGVLDRDARCGADQAKLARRHQFALIPASFTSLPCMSYSLRISAASSSGERVSTSMPCFARRSRTCGLFRVCTTPACTFATMSAGVPPGSTTAVHVGS